MVYGQKTGNTPDGRRAGTPFAPGANPMYGRDRKGAVASLTSVAKLPFTYAKDGISYTFTVSRCWAKKIQYVKPTCRPAGWVFPPRSGCRRRSTPQRQRNQLGKRRWMPSSTRKNILTWTIRVSGYAVRFNALTREQQQDVISRTFIQALASGGCMKKIIETQRAPGAIGPYVQGVDLGRRPSPPAIWFAHRPVIFLADVQDQARLSLENVKAIVVAAGAERGRYHQDDRVYHRSE